MGRDCHHYWRSFISWSLLGISGLVPVMGTTTTPNQGLIKPDLNEPMENWARSIGLDDGQNAVNCNKIDEVFDVESAVYTPTWTAESGNPTLGSGGFVGGRYLRLWKKLVIGYVRVSAGTTGFLPGSGIYHLTLPFTVASFLDSDIPLEVPLGKAILRDNSTVLTSEAPIVCYDPTANDLIVRLEPGGGTWSNTNPFAMAQSDRMSGYFSYLTDEA